MAGDKWELDHKIALINGGENRETNLAPALSFAHKIKTRTDVAEKSKIARIRAKHLGIHPRSKRKIPSRGFNTTRATALSSLAESDGEILALELKSDA